VCGLRDRGRASRSSQPGAPITVETPRRSQVDDSMILPPAADPDSVEILRGPNIAPRAGAAGTSRTCCVGPYCWPRGDNITTDDIMPAGAQILPLRSNIPAILPLRLLPARSAVRRAAQRMGGASSSAGSNYGQARAESMRPGADGAGRASRCWPRSFARIHQANLVNCGILPLTIPGGRGGAGGDELEIIDIRARIASRHPPGSREPHPRRGASKPATISPAGRRGFCWRADC